MDARTARAVPVLLALGCTWGASFLFIHVIVDDTGPMELVFGRLFFGMLAIGAYVLVTRHRFKVTPVLVAQVSLMAVFTNIIPFGLIALGQEHISSGNASILNATVPIFTSVIAAAVLAEEYLTPARIGGLALGLIGVGVLTGEDVLDVTSASVLGQFAIVLAALCYGSGAVYARQLLRKNEPVTLALLQTSLGTLITIPILLAVRGGTPDYNISLEAWGSILALGVLGTGLGYIGWLWLIENVGSVRASLVTYIVPCIAVVLGWLVLDESIGVNTIAGGLLIVAGVASVMRGAAPPAREGTIIVPVGAPETVSAEKRSV
jgi:drug/metabolite transporter (DMT)-like permease